MENVATISIYFVFLCLDSSAPDCGGPVFSGLASFACCTFILAFEDVKAGAEEDRHDRISFKIVCDSSFGF